MPDSAANGTGRLECGAKGVKNVFICQVL